MKFRTTISMQMILMGLAAALLFASSAYAQQEMDPATFPDGPNVEPFRQPAAVTVNNATTTMASKFVPGGEASDPEAESPLSLAAPRLARRCLRSSSPPVRGGLPTLFVSGPNVWVCRII